MTDPISTLREQLRQLLQERESGRLDAKKFEASKARLERKLLDAVMAAAPALAQQPAAPAAVPVPEAPARRAGALLWVGAALFVGVVAAAGYAYTGSPGEIGKPPPGFVVGSGADGGAAAPADGTASAPHAIGREQIEGMVAKLAARLKEVPDDAEGWGMLGRTYMALDRHAEALDAYGRALKLRPDDATALADYADALAVKNGQTLEGEPLRLIERALKSDPDNLKALALAGTAAYNRGDYATAVKHWDRAARVGPAESQMAQMARAGAAEARQRGNLPPLAEAAAGAGPRLAPATPAAASSLGVSGTVRLAAGLKAQAAPEDTVFIFARAATGVRMPLAIVRKQVKDLPFDFRLDDSLSMSPTALLSAAGTVVVGARVSKSGQAMPESGDLEGLSAPLKVGASGVVVEIGTRRP
jgi:cytochrome c-type biogenesis protein CcmH